MRLTFRAMLAYLDNNLPAEDAADIAKKIAESQYASDLMNRVHDVMRRLRLSAPRLDGRGMGLDPNSVAEYLDNEMPSERVGDFERVCLESDVHLAEVAACHQILTLILGEPVEVPAGLTERMYALGRDGGAKAITSKASTAAAAATATTEATAKAESSVSDTAKAKSAGGVVTPPSLPDKHEKLVTAEAVAENPLLTPSKVIAEKRTLEVPDYLRDPPKKKQGVPLLTLAALIALLASVGFFFFGTEPGKDLRSKLFPKVPVVADKDPKTTGGTTGSATAPATPVIPATTTPATSTPAATPPEATISPAGTSPGTTPPGTTPPAPLAQPPMTAALTPDPAGTPATAPATLPPLPAATPTPPVTTPGTAPTPPGTTPAPATVTPAPVTPATVTPMPVTPPATAPAFTPVIPGTAPAAPTVPVTVGIPTPTPLPGTTPAPATVATPAIPVPTPITPAPLIPATTAPGTLTAPVAVAPAPAAVTPAVAAPVAMGTITSTESVIVGLSTARGSNWKRLVTQSQVLAGDRVLSLPGFRSALGLSYGLNVQFVGTSMVELVAPDARNIPGLYLHYGRMQVSPNGKADAEVRLGLGNRQGLATFMTPDATLAIEVRTIRVDGEDPSKVQAPLVIDMFVTQGEVKWSEPNAAEPTLIRAPSRLSLGVPPVPGSPGEQRLPEWLVSDDRTEQDKLAAPVIERDTRGDRAITLALKELADDRRVEVRLLAVRCLMYLGEYESLVQALRDESQSRNWDAQIDALREACTISPPTAQKVRQALDAHRGATKGDELFRMLYGYTTAQLKQGSASTLIKSLDHEDLDFRVLSFWNLRRIAPKASSLYRPEHSAAKRRPQIVKWEQLLETGQLVPKT